jgi:hypothetical protein
MELSTGKILEENLVQSAFHQTLGDALSFQQENPMPNLDWSCLPRRLNVPEWPSYSFDLNLLKNLWQDLNGCLAMINQQFDRA